MAKAATNSAASATDVKYLFMVAMCVCVRVSTFSSIKLTRWIQSMLCARLQLFDWIVRRGRLTRARKILSWMLQLRENNNIETQREMSASFIKVVVEDAQVRDIASRQQRKRLSVKRVSISLWDNLLRSCQSAREHIIIIIMQPLL